MPTTVLDQSISSTIDFFAVADVLAAIAATAHVLLNKRDVRAAIGWIGLAWLAPLSGPILYYLFGINRVTRRAARFALSEGLREPVPPIVKSPTELRLPENIATIASVGGRLTGLPLMEGNSISLLQGGDEAYPAMLAAIRTARRTVVLSSYIFRADAVGRAFVEALRQARERGVDVRVLVDGVGSGYLVSSAVRELSQSGIAAARFLHHWLPWRMPFLNMRSHKKILVIDGIIGFVGGLNIGVENWRRLRPTHPVKDIHFQVTGPVVALLMRSFAEDWAFTTGGELDGLGWWPQLEPVGTVIARGFGSGPDEDRGTLEAVLATAVSSSKQRLRIVTPYFLPDHQLMAAIALAALRGVQVDIVLPEHSDHALLDWAMRAHLSFFAVPGMSIYLTPAPFDHAKLVTVDGFWSAFGSANWDVRSLRLNFEFMMECYDAHTAGEIDRRVDEKIARARPLPLKELADRALAVRFRDSAARLLLPYL